FGSASFVPLFVQAVLGATATMAGVALTPQMFFWTLASITGTRLLLRFHFRALALTGMMALFVGALMLTQISATTPQWILWISMALTGIGMGLSVPIFLIAVQSTVPRQALGTATATVQFARSIGGAIGVSVMGVVLAAQLGAGIVAAGLDPKQISVDALLEPEVSASAALTSALRGALTGAVQAVFIVALIAAACAWIAVALAPRTPIGSRPPAMEKGVPAE
ncbi:MAG: MFS transporter, partial [Chloroflexota bacterium]